MLQHLYVKFPLSPLHPLAHLHIVPSTWKNSWTSDIAEWTSLGAHINPCHCEVSLQPYPQYWNRLLQLRGGKQKIHFPEFPIQKGQDLSELKDFWGA